MLDSQQDQQHPRAESDRAVIQRLFQEGITDYNLAELARLRIRYNHFPGARDLQRDLDLLLQQWQLNEEQLFAKTRQLHADRKVYQRSDQSGDDWS